MTTTPRAPTLPREIWVLVAAAFVIAMGYGLVAPVLPQFAQSFDVGVAASSVVVSVFAFFRLVFAPAGGRLVARLGERPVYLTGLLIVAASSAATAFAQSYAQLLIFRGLGGIGSTMFTVSAMGLIIRLAPPAARGRASAAYGSAFLIGGIGGPLAGGLLAEAGLQVPFLVYAAALVLAATVVAVLLRPATLRRPAGTVEKPPMTLREAAAHPSYRAALASAFAHGWSNFGVRTAIVPLFATAALGAGAWAAGAALAAFAIGNAAALSPAGRLTDARGRKPLVLLGLVVGGVLTAALGLAGNVTVLLVLSAAAGIGTGLLSPAQQATVGDVIGHERSGGPVLATFSMFQDAGAILGPILAGLLVDHVGYGAAFAVSGGISLLAAAAWLPAEETLPGREPAGRETAGRGDRPGNSDRPGR
ncbi:MFS transporter [Georgenia yuyongxinii]|uniref:MFS transporter n=1 Tax=Georgenia yuyongxinii TaxID=2589797 RepID=A0A5B8C017_9MICO|nr:MFS transporter [Georgenia yuyongxinii]QDC23330.1 MFS transporter [Georgenia yuyongxinii]